MNDYKKLSQCQGKCTMMSPMNVHGHSDKIKKLKIYNVKCNVINSVNSKL
jgi:hypothetical protein